LDEKWEHVDPLNRKATDRYIDVTLVANFAAFSGVSGLDVQVHPIDSEGSFGGPIVWTPEFFETFQARKGYDFRRFLPLLVNDGGAITAKVRNDYNDVVSELFVDNFFKPIADWAFGPWH